MLGGLVFGEFAPVIEDLPAAGRLLGRALPFVRGAISGLINYLTNESQNASIDSLQNQVNALAAAFQSVTQAELYTDDREAKAWLEHAHILRDLAGTVKALGENQDTVWTRLRYTIMPNTIANMYTFIWRAGIDPLRVGLIRSAKLSAGWFERIEGFLLEERMWANRYQTTTRQWRRKYVYPQLLYVLDPFKFAYWNRQAISTAVAYYLNNPDNHEHRDAVSRVVYEDMGRLWQAFDKYLAQWLQTDIGVYGWGDDVPGFPNKAKRMPPPDPPGVWEPWQTQPHAPKVQSYLPDIPAQNFTRGW